MSTHDNRHPVNLDVIALLKFLFRYSYLMPQAILIVDNLRIGGFQRLVLDQAYGLSERGYKTRIYLLDDIPDGTVPSFLSSESALIAKFGIELLTLGKSRLVQLGRLHRISLKADPQSLVLSHSLRATFLLFFVNLKFRKRLRVISTIHQLPTLFISISTDLPRIFLHHLKLVRKIHILAVFAQRQ